MTCYSYHKLLPLPLGCFVFWFAGEFLFWVLVCLSLLTSTKVVAVSYRFGQKMLESVYA